MKNLVLYHKNCFDGFCAGYAAREFLGDEAEYYPIQYGGIKSIDDIHKLGDLKRDVYIFDFSFSKEIMDYIISESTSFTWLDHHKTAFEMWCGMDYDINTPYVEIVENKSIILDNNKSGALITWEYFHPNDDVPLFIKYADDGDRWQFKLEGTKAFTKAIWSYAPWSFEQFNSWFNTDVLKSQLNIYHDFLVEGDAILRAHNANVQSVIKGASRVCHIPVTMFGDEKVLVGMSANCPPHLQSDVGHELAIMSEDGFGLLWTINKDNLCICSLRSIADVDVSAIAKLFGGGGHHTASGFTIHIKELLNWIR